MDCPKCNTLMTDGTYESIQAYFCNECSGIMFNQNKLSIVLNKMSLDLFSTLSINSILPSTPNKTKHAKCPECKGVMKNYGYMGSKKVLIDSCSSCNWLWLDPGELSAMAKMYTQLEKNKEHLEDIFGRKSDIVGTHITTKTLTEYFLLGFVVSAGTHLARKMLE